jgi:hypothetical protein
MRKALIKIIGGKGGFLDQAHGWTSFDGFLKADTEKAEREKKRVLNIKLMDRQGF